jgi:hypothetical protein
MKPDLPEGVKLPPGFSVNTDDPRYKALHDLATRENLSQRAFSAILASRPSGLRANTSAPGRRQRPWLPRLPPRSTSPVRATRSRTRSPIRSGADVDESAALQPVYHRTLGGRVTVDAMNADERAFAVASAPWEWSLSPRLFAPWPLDRVRGEPVYPPSLADTAQSRAPQIWDLAK